MIKATDLRIGNYVNYQQNEVKIIGLTHEVGFINVFEKNEFTEYKKIKPVPITEERLIKLGFEKWSYYENYLIKETDIFDIVFNIITQEIEFYFDGVFIQANNIKSVHQVQNLYHPLKGCDLEQE